MSATIEKACVSNYGPFRGEFELALGEETYAIVGLWVHDETRSNWSGKSWFASLVPFVALGEHPAATEDKWITDGEAEGSVELLFRGGLWAKRSRRRGKSTQVEAKLGGQHAKGSEAEEMIARFLGFGKDLRETIVVRQKKLTEFITKGPTERARTAASWFGLESLELGASNASSALREAVKKRGIALVRLEGREAEVAADRQAFGVEEGEDLLEVVAAEIELAKGEQQVAELRVTALGERVAQIESLLRFDALRTELDALAVPLEGKDPAEVDGRRRLAIADERSAAEKLRSAQQVASGEFDGQCPIAGRRCPVTKEINEGRASSAKRLREAQAAHLKVRTELSALDTEHTQALTLRRTRERVLAERGRLEKTIAQLGQQAAQGPDGPEQLEQLRQEYTEAAAELEQLREEVAKMQAVHARARASTKAAADLRAEIQGLEREMMTARLGVQVMGPNGAQRDLAAGALSEIEGGANEFLAATELRVALTWGRETGQLETHCGECGATYPRGRSVKTCECGAERGHKVTPRLDLVTNVVSDGAAEDMAALSFQIAAAAWLRRRRSARASFLVIDEPHGSLDEANRRAVGAVLGAAARRLGFSQVFVISHSRDALEAMQRRVVVRAGPGGSTLTVE